MSLSDRSTTRPTGRAVPECSIARVVLGSSVMETDRRECLTDAVPRILIAPDKFKGSLGADAVAETLRDALLARRPDLEVLTLPVADGGDGTLKAALAAGYEQVPVTVAGPTGEPVTSAYARSGDVALVELADASGLTRLPGGRPCARTATSRGTGELVAAALDAGCRHIVLGIGGSACTDGGAGMVQALGARLLDRDGAEIGPGGSGLADLSVLDVSRLHPSLPDAEVIVACDVDNPLTGPHGAAPVYGPQKGASTADVTALDAALAHWADVVTAATGVDLRESAGAGAAGGVGFAALSLLGARLSPGIDLVLDLIGFHDLVGTADLVVVGEGSLDEQTLRGKAVAGVATAGRAAGTRVVAVCGRCTLSDAQLQEVGIDAAYELLDLEPDPSVCMGDAGRLLGQLAERILSGGHLPDEPAALSDQH